MPRTRRLVNGEEKTAYHIMSRAALDGFPFGDVENELLEPKGLCQQFISDLSTASSQNTKRNQSR